MMIVLDICAVLSITLIFTIYFAVSWATFDKAGKPGWATFVPIYRKVVLLQILGKPMWWLALLYIPCLNFVTAPIALILIAIELAKRFGRGGGFIAGMILLPYLFYPILAFGSSEYTAPETA